MDKGSNMCRTCLSENSEMYSLFAYVELKSNGPSNFANMLASISIQITAEDGLPNHICKTCSKILNLTYTFKQQCEESNIWLHEHFVKSFVPAIVEEPLADTTKAENPDIQANGDNLQIIKSKQALVQRTINKSLCKSKLEDKKPPGKNFSPQVSKQVNQKFLKLELPDGFEVSEGSHDKLPTLYKCMKCNKVSENEIEYYRHKRSHRSYICKLCARSFRSGHGLSYHMKHHQGIKKFVCTYENCNKSFIIKQGLEKHMSVHNAEKNYLCSRCGKTFSLFDSLSYHIKTHGGERPHLCTHCGKTFKQACHLNTHMWNHTGIKPYLCSTCGKRYTTSHQLKRHVAKNCGSRNRKHPSEISAKTKKALKIQNTEQDKNNQQSSEIRMKVEKLPKKEYPEEEENNHLSDETDYFENKDEIILEIEEIDIKNL